ASREMRAARSTLGIPLVRVFRRVATLLTLTLSCVIVPSRTSQTPERPQFARESEGFAHPHGHSFSKSIQHHWKVASLPMVNSRLHGRASPTRSQVFRLNEMPTSRCW